MPRMADSIRGELHVAGFDGDFATLETIVDALIDSGFTCLKQLDSCCAMQDISNFRLLDAASQAFIQVVVESATVAGRAARAQRYKLEPVAAIPCLDIVPDWVISSQAAAKRPRRCMRSSCDWGSQTLCQKFWRCSTSQGCRL